MWKNPTPEESKRLLDITSIKLRLRNQVAISLTFGCSRQHIHHIMKHRESITPRMILTLMEETGWTLPYIKSLWQQPSCLLDGGQE